jgi:hypothetical protein
MQYIILNLLFLLSAIFLISGIAKAYSNSNFETTLRLLNIPYPKFSSRLFIGVEILLGITIPFSIFCVWASLALSLLFIFFVVQSKRLKVSIDCNCFGSLSNDKLGTSTIVRALVMAIIAIAIIIYPNLLLSTFPGWIIVFTILNAFTLVSFYLTLDNGIKFLKILMK